MAFYVTRKTLVHRSGGSMTLRDDAVPPQHYTVSQPRRPRVNHHRRENLKSRN